MARALLAAVTAAIAALMLAAPASAVRATHIVSAEGQLVDRWTINEPKECGLVGSGTLTVSFKTVTARVFPFIDPHQRNGRGSWVVGLPFGYRGSLIKDLPAIKASGTITREDNTSRTPQFDGSPCPLPKVGCGTTALRLSSHRPGALAEIGRHDRRHIAVGLASEAFDLGRFDSCHTGALDNWSGNRRLTGGAEDGNLPAKMPKPSTLKRRRITRVTGTGHKVTVGTDPLSPENGTTTDDVTRRVTVTFKRR